MKYRRLFDLRIQHEFFAGRGCPDLRIEPGTRTPGGARALDRHRLLARARPDGLEVIARVDGDGRPVVPLPADLRLEFAVRVTDMAFVLYTEMDPWRAVAGPTYRGSRADGGALTLGPGDSPASREDAARIEVSTVSAAWLAAPPRFTLGLAAPAAPWVFYMLTARPNGPLPEIHDEDAARSLAFERVQLAPGEVAASDDPVGHRLLAHHHGRCFRFTSTSKVACRSAPVRGLALHLGSEVLLRELGGPDIRSRTALKLLPDQPAQPSLYRIVAY